MKPVILVTGSNGQLGLSLQKIASSYPSYEFVFLTREDLSIEDETAIVNTFEKYKPAFCINCAAYTAVDKAESEKEKAFSINAYAVGMLAKTCLQYDCKFIHISTDYVFDGLSNMPYTEKDDTNPLNVYGQSKLLGEQLALQRNESTVIIRTSWVYYEKGHNFVLTMKRLMTERESINVVHDQAGSPTYAPDLARVILDILSYDEWIPGIYHFSNDASISWYQFAQGIKELIQSNCQVHPINTDQYPTPARRPHYTVMSKEKIISTYHIALNEWKKSLEHCLSQINS